MRSRLRFAACAVLLTSALCGPVSTNTLLAEPPPKLDTAPKPVAEAALAAARTELLDAFVPPTQYERDLDFIDAQRAREENALRTLRPVDALIQLFTADGEAPAGINVRGFHGKLDLVTKSIPTDAKGRATLRLPPGSWQVNVSGTIKDDLLVFGRTSIEVPVRGERSFDVPLLTETKIRFRDTGNAPTKPERVDLATNDLTHRLTWRGDGSSLDVLRPNAEPYLVQMLRVPTQRPGYYVRATVDATDFELSARGKDATKFIFPGSPVVKLTPSLDSMDALSAPITFDSNRNETLVIRGLPQMAVSYKVDSGGKKYRFYTAPLDVTGKDRTFGRRAPFDVSVGTYWASPGRFNQHRYCVSARIFLRDENGLIMVGSNKKAPFPVKWRAVLRGKELNSGTLGGAWHVRLPAMKEKADFQALEFDLELSDTGKTRRLRVIPQQQKQFARVGRVQIQALPQLEANAQAWARWVNDLADSFAEAQHRRPSTLTYCLWVHAMPGLSGWGGWNGNRAWGYFKDGHLFGYARPNGKNNGTASHEMTHGHHIYAHGTHFNRVQNRALRRMWARRTDGFRRPGGQKHLPWLEALPQSAPLELTGGVPVGSVSGVDPQVDEDEVVAWYVRQNFGVKVCNDWRYHHEFLRWWLTINGFTDDEARAGILQHFTKQNLAWLVRNRGGAVSDRRADAAALLASTPDKLKRPVIQVRNAAVKRWKDPDLASEPDLDAALAKMEGELGQWSTRAKVYLKAAQLTSSRKDRAATKRNLLDALRCAASLSREAFDRTLDAAAETWARTPQ